MNRILVRIFGLAFLCVGFSWFSTAQSGGINTGLAVTADNITPAPGAGHDYVHLLSETVSPANGSVNLQIGYGAPPSRGITLPAAYVYDTGSVFNLLQDPNSSYVAFEQPFSVGQHDLFPVATWSESSYQLAPQGTSAEPVIQPYCNYATGFTFRGPDGVGHNLPLVAINKSLNASVNGNGNCSGQGVSSNQTGDGVVTAAFVSPATTLSDVADWSVGSSPSGNVGAFTVADPSGTTYFFSGSSGASQGFGSFQQYAYQIEDRNGNIISSSGCGPVSSIPYCDTAGRPVETKTSTGLTVGGVPYVVSTGTAGNAVVNYTVPSLFIPPASEYYIGCTQLSPHWAVPVSTATLKSFIPREQIITLPTTPATQYTLYFGDFNPTDSTITNPYGLINEIIYPDGGWVKYTWAIPPATNTAGAPNYTQSATFPGIYVAPSTQAGQPAIYGCTYEYSTPAVATRTVSYDGKTPAQTQNFSYLTTWATGTNAGTWTTKSTSVTTIDNVINKSALTVYSYQPGALAAPTAGAWGAVASVFPVERTITRYDWNNTTTPIDTETKGWFNTSVVSQLACDFHTISTGQSTGHFYKYSAVASSQITDDKEYDYGQITAPATACTGNIPAAPATPLPTRETVTNYQSFTSLYGATFVKPSSVLLYDYLGRKITETDYTYDQNTLATVTATNHDETAFKPSIIKNRGNVTTLTRQCFGCTNSTTTYTYDETGQLASMTDPCGNISCGDMPGVTNHQTTYSYTDSPSNATSAGSSNAYLTLVTNPLGQTKSYQYDYTSGQLTKAFDENTQYTQYCYTVDGCGGTAQEPLFRLSGVSYPDGGSKIITYSDAAPSPSITTKTLINASTNINMTTETVMDGMGHVISSELVTDPVNPVYVLTGYDGMGHVHTVTNPYRFVSEITYGVTTSLYDAIGRKITQTQSDSSSKLHWCYSNFTYTGQTNCLANASTKTTNSWIDFSDENGHHWQRSYDGLGRLGSVMEPNSSNAPGIETDYSYNALDELSAVTQNGVSGETARKRTFVYDSLGRLASSLNPETGLVCYGAMVSGVCQGSGYDANGNVFQRTDARNVVTNYSYDTLNRLLSKRYTNDPSGSPSSCYVYDQSSIPYGIGRLSIQWTQTTAYSLCQTSNTHWTKRAILGYDQMGRVLSEQQYTPATVASGTPYTPTYVYDQAGNLISSTDGVTPNPTTAGTKLTFTSCIDTANRLQTLSSNWTDGTHPQSLFSAQGSGSNPCANTSSPAVTSAPYAAFGGLTNAILGKGLTITRAYDNRLRITAETDTGGATTAETTGSATVIVTGMEQSQ